MNLFDLLEKDFSEEELLEDKVLEDDLEDDDYEDEFPLDLELEEDDEEDEIDENSLLGLGKLKKLEHVKAIEALKKPVNEKLLIIDGSSLLSTSFYGTAKDLMFAKTEEQKEQAYKKLMQTKDGVYTNGIYGFMKTFNKIIENQKPTHVAVAFDLSRATTFRKQMYDDYKGTRSKTPTPLSQQFKLMQEVLEYIGVPVFKSYEYEADDFAGSLARRFEDEIPVYCHTKDNDYLQILKPGKNVRIWLVTSKCDEMFEEVGLDKKEFNLPDGVFEYTVTSFKQLQGLNTPEEFIDAKAILGDKSDNIPGVHGVGEKAVIPLIREYSTIENLYEEIEGLTPKEEKELKKFFKESLGISRSPISYLLKDGEITLEGGEKISYNCIVGEPTEEQLSRQEIYREKLGDLRFPIDVNKDEDFELLKSSNIQSVNLSAKESAFLSKDLARIKTDIEEVQDLKLDDLALNIDKTKYNEKMLELEMKSLIKK